MKRIIISLSIIIASAAIVVGGTVAYFSDTETAEDNVITTGTIDIAVSGDNPWSGQFIWDDVKPGECESITMNITNVGDNPVRLWKSIKCLNCEENGVIDPEQDWYDQYNGGDSKNNIDEAIVYEMLVDDKMVINHEAGITLNQISNNYIGLLKLDQATDPGYSGPDPNGSGVLNPGGSITVEQTYCLKEEVGNWAQSDKMSFLIEIESRQVNTSEPLQQIATYDNKYPGWSFSEDETIGLLKYDYQAPEFNYDFYATGLEQSEYCLIYAKDPNENNKILIDRGSPNPDNTLSLIGSTDLDSIPHEDDTNSQFGAKIWLINCEDYNENDQSVFWSNNMRDWLWDNWPGFVNYRKGEKPSEPISCDNVENNSNTGENNPETKTIHLANLNTTSHFGDDSYDYDQANISFTYDTPADDQLTGVIETEGLQPYTTYQVKFIGKPTCDGGSGDDAVNELIGYKGRWTCLDCSCSGATCNRSDTEYENNTSECIGGYLVWDYFTTNENGDAVKTIITDNSYHVLRCNGGVCGDTNDSQLNNSDCSGSNPAYPYCDASDVEGELERPGSFPCNGLTLDEGSYNLELVLTEECFHTGCAGTWTTVMSQDIEFEIE